MGIGPLGPLLVVMAGHVPWVHPGAEDRSNGGSQDWTCPVVESGYEEQVQRRGPRLDMFYG
ncbi:hypothetical protein GCM10009825_13480 [Arthrobacter humicola]|uniref:Uncharacterized protein n=1 Tax=Arthrobacter humicola TaxID=409291 RepID=A0ABP5KFD8_9MICC